MTEINPKTAVSLPFRATLEPHRSLSPRGFLLFMAAIGGVSFVTGMLFLLAGAWPVTFFFGLDVALIYFAFRLNYRDARRGEIVDVTREAITLTQYDVKGHSRHREFNPAWSRFELTTDHTGRSELTVTSRGEAIAIGSFLTDEERAELADVLARVLIEARGGVRI